MQCHTNILVPHVLRGQVVDQSMEDGRVRVNLKDDHKVVVQDILSETVDELDFRDKVIKISLGFDHLIVTTSTQCHIYSTSNWNTPHIFDLKDTVTLVMQCERHFLIMDNSTGIQLYTYEGRQICNPKYQGACCSLAQRILTSLDVAYPLKCTECEQCTAGCAQQAHFGSMVARFPERTILVICTLKPML